MAKTRKRSTSLCENAAIILNQDLEFYRRGRMAYEDFRSRYQMVQDLNLPVVCEKTGRSIEAVQRKSGRRVTIEERECSCTRRRKKAIGRK